MYNENMKNKKAFTTHSCRSERLKGVEESLSTVHTNNLRSFDYAQDDKSVKGFTLIELFASSARTCNW